VVGPAVLALLGWAADADAQNAYATRSAKMRIPFGPLPANAQVQEVRLHVSTDGRTYRHVATARPDQKEFHYTAPGDGWYYFATQTFDIFGSFSPPDMSRVEASIKVLVDNRPPVIDLREAVPNGGNVAVSWDVQDEWAEPGGMTAQYRVAGGAWKTLDLPRQLNGTYSWTAPGEGPVEVTMTVTDKAGNVAQKDVRLTPRAVNPGGQRQQQQQDTQQQPLDGALRYVNSPEVLIEFEITKQGKSGVREIEVWVTRDPQVNWELNRTEPNPKSPLTVTLGTDGRYGVTLVGVSGVGEAVTRPSARKDKPDQPQMWFEVDTKKPVVAFEGNTPTVTLGEHDGRMLIRWSASDKNLAANPVTLSYCVDPAKGDWTVIAADLPNNRTLTTGEYEWRLPADGLPLEFYVRVQAKDLAGNVGEAVTRDKVKVDTVKPLIVPRDVKPKGKP
jgi:hypothetical protein